MTTVFKSLDALSYEMSLFHAWKSFDYKTFFSCIEILIDVDKPDFSKDALRSSKYYYIRLASNIEQYLKTVSSEYTTVHDLTLQIIKSIDQYESLEDLEQYIIRTFPSYYPFGLKEESQPYSSKIQSAIHYIHGNLNQELSLEFVSDYLSVHPVYLSSVFKKETGENFIDYINKQKIKDSMTLLASSKTSITDISLHYGYCNSSYYSQLFKKYVGISPNLYRKQNSII